MTVFFDIELKAQEMGCDTPKEIQAFLLGYSFRGKVNRRVRDKKARLKKPRGPYKKRGRKPSVQDIPTTYQVSRAIREIERIMSPEGGGWSISFARKKVCGHPYTAMHKAVVSDERYHQLAINYGKNKGFTEKFMIGRIGVTPKKKKARCTHNNEGGSVVYLEERNALLSNFGG